MYGRKHESHSQIIADVQCHTLRCTTCSETPDHQPLTHPETAQGHERRAKNRGHSLTSRWVTHNEAQRKSLTAHHDKETDTDTPVHTLTTAHAWISPLSALSTAGDEMCVCVSDENQQLT